jgi:PAS domain S-box-containing protein
MTTPPIGRDSESDEPFLDMDSLRQRLAQETQARRQAEAAVQHGDVQYRTLLEGLPQGVCILQDNRVQFVNRALLRLFGYAQATEVLGQDIRTFFAPHDRQRWEDCQPHLLPAEQGALRWEMQVLQSDMRPIWLETSVSQTRWEDTSAIASGAEEPGNWPSGRWHCA